MGRAVGLPLVAIVLSVSLVTPARANQAGGLAYQEPARRPVATTFTVSPSPLTAGTVPAIGMRIDQARARWVTARLVFAPQGGGTLLRVALGRIAANTSITVQPSAAAGLVAGRYRVRLHVRGSGGTTLLRSKTAPGIALILVRPAAVPATLPTGVFPVAGPNVLGEGFGVSRPGHVHQGQDIAAAKGTPVVAPLAGVVSAVGYQASAAGEYVVEHTADGFDFFFAHCVRHSTAVAPGQKVAAGTALCAVGESGDASGPHLHFEMWTGGWRVDPSSRPIDPLPALRSWDAS